MPYIFLKYASLWVFGNISNHPRSFTPLTLKTKNTPNRNQYYRETLHFKKPIVSYCKITINSTKLWHFHAAFYYYTKRLHFQKINSDIFCVFTAVQNVSNFLNVEISGNFKRVAKVSNHYLLMEFRQNFVWTTILQEF